MAAPQILLKPGRPIINWGNPLTKGLVLDSPFWEGAGVSKTKELVTNLDGTIAGATWDRNFYGIDLNFSAATSRVQYTVPAMVQSLTYLSVESLIYYRSNGGGSLGRIVNKGPGTGTGTYFFIFTDTANLAGQYVTFATGYSTASDNWRSNSQLVAGNWYHLVHTMVMNTGIGTQPNFYLNGTNDGTVRSATGSGTLAVDDANLYIGNRADSTRNFDGKIAYSRIWNRLLTHTEIRSLYTNPWQIYKQYNFLNYYNSNPVVGGTSVKMQAMRGWSFPI